MRTRLFLYNSITSASLQALNLLTGLVLPRLYISTYGSEVNGLMVSIVQFVSYFTFVAAGLNLALIYALYKPLAELDKITINSIFNLADRLYMKAGGLYFLLVILLAAVYPFIIKSENIGLGTIVALVLVIGLCGALELYTLAKYRVLLAADQQEYIISVVSILTLLISFALTVVLIHEHTPIEWVRTAPLVSIVLRSLLFHYYIKYKYPFINKNRQKKSGQPETFRLTRRWDALVMQLSVSLNLSLPVVIVAVFCSLKMASVYSVYSMVFTGLIAIIGIFTTGISAAMGNIIAKDEFNILEAVHNQYEFAIYAVLTFLYSCALILINPFISVYTSGLTDINYVHLSYGILFVAWGILYNINIPYTAIVEAAGLYKETRSVNIGQVLILIGLAVLLVRIYDIYGVLLAMIISALYWGIGLIVIINRSTVQVSLVRIFRRIMRIFIVLLFSYLPFISWVRINADNIYEWFIWAIGVAAWCGFTTLLFNYFLDRQTLKFTALRLKMLLAQVNLRRRAE